MKVVYALSEKGVRERAAARPTLPAELTGLLRMVDGRRTREDLMAAVGKNAIVAGGLRWLTAAGYIRPATDAELAASAWVSVPPRTGVAAPVGSRSDADVCRSLSQFMVQAIRRRLGEGGYPHRRQVERATSVAELLPHLNPLIDAIAERAGDRAAAEFADTAAFILNPLRPELQSA